MSPKAVAVVALVTVASCAPAPKQPDPGQGYTLETTGAVVGRDVPRQRNEPDATIGEVAARLAGQICEREARCRGGSLSDQCMRTFRRIVALEVVTWPCSPAATRSRAKECVAALNAEPCEMDFATKPALCPPSPACPDAQANLIPSGAMLAQDWRTAGAPSFERAAVAALDVIDVRPCIAKAVDEGIAEAQQREEPELRVRPPTTAHISVTFAPDGGVLTSELDRGLDGSAVDLDGTATGECIIERFRTARVPQFAGAPRSIGVSIRLD